VQFGAAEQLTRLYAELYRVNVCTNTAALVDAVSSAVASELIRVSSDTCSSATTTDSYRVALAPYALNTATKQVTANSLAVIPALS
jgi:hypothetical protein